MEITDIRVFPVDEEKLKAFVTIVLDGCFVVSDIKIINGASGLFISMPSKRRKNGTFRDLAHPLNSETRNMLEQKILAKYEEILASGTPPRRLHKPRELAEAEADRFFDQSRQSGVSEAPPRPRPGLPGY